MESHEISSTTSTLAHTSLFSDEIQTGVNDTIQKCFDTIFEGKENAVLNEKTIHTKKIIFLGILKPLSPTDPFWKEVHQTTQKTCFFVHVLMQIGNGNVKEVFNVLYTYRVDADLNSNSVVLNLVHHVEKIAYLIWKKETIGAANELALLKKLSHRNIIGLISDYQITYMDKTPMTKTVLMQELMMGDMKKLYSDPNFHLSILQAKSIVNQVLAALEYLKSMNIAHIDIKPQNCLFIEDSQGITIKISDLESCFSVKERKFSTNYTPAIAPIEIVAAFAHRNLAALQKNANSTELSEVQSSFIQHFPLRVAFENINEWGAGILIQETFFKLIQKKMDWLTHFPWANALVKINKWALPRIYPEFSIPLSDVALSAMEVANAFKNFRLEKTENDEAKIIGNIALGFLTLLPEKRISFQEAKEILEPKLKRKLSQVTLLSPNKKSKNTPFEKENTFLVPFSSPNKIFNNDSRYKFSPEKILLNSGLKDITSPESRPIQRKESNLAEKTQVINNSPNKKSPEKILVNITSPKHHSVQRKLTFETSLEPTQPINNSQNKTSPEKILNMSHKDITQFEPRQVKRKLTFGSNSLEPTQPINNSQNKNSPEKIFLNRNLKNIPASGSRTVLRKESNSLEPTQPIIG